MKLTLPFFFVALLGVGIMPVAASSPISVSDETNLDPTETARARIGMDDPSSISPDSEDGGGWYSAIAPVIESPQPVVKKSQLESTELSVGQQPVGADEKLNS
ncbi:TonB-dependent siderophore receptor, partial [Microcoleus sp. herbarium8]